MKKEYLIKPIDNGFLITCDTGRFSKSSIRRVFDFFEYRCRDKMKKKPFKLIYEEVDE